MLNNEHRWMAETLRRIIWPEPSCDLHDRIMARIDYPMAHITPYTLPKFKITIALTAVFFAAFGLGMLHNQRISSGALYVSAAYYGGMDDQTLYHILGT